MTNKIFKLTKAIADTAKQVKAVEKKQAITRNCADYDACEKELYLLAYKMERLANELEGYLSIHREVVDSVNRGLMLTCDDIHNVTEEIYELMK